MAGPGSRLEKFGTIYSRVTGLLKSGALKYSERPVWYDVYAAFPPQMDATLSRPEPTESIINILYMEDFIRAKFYEKYGTADVIDMKDEENISVSQRFVEKYMEFERTGEEKNLLFQSVVDALATEGIELKSLEEIKEERLKAERLKQEALNEKRQLNVDIKETLNMKEDDSNKS